MLECEMFFGRNARGVQLFLGPQHDVSDVVTKLLFTYAQQADPDLKMTKKEFAMFLLKKNCLFLPPQAPLDDRLLSRPFLVDRGFYCPIYLETTDKPDVIQVCRPNGRKRSVEIIQKAFPCICEMTDETIRPMAAPQTIEVQLAL